MFRIATAVFMTAFLLSGCGATVSQVGVGLVEGKKKLEKGYYEIGSGARKVKIAGAYVANDALRETAYGWISHGKKLISDGEALLRVIGEEK